MFLTKICLKTCFLLVIESGSFYLRWNKSFSGVSAVALPFELINILFQVKTFKRIAEEQEVAANATVSKYRKLQLELTETEERAEMAETQLQKFHVKK